MTANAEKFDALTNWLVRYDGEPKFDAEHSVGEFKVRTSRAKDRWTGGPVCITAIELKSGQKAAELAERARLLQNIDHAHIQPVIDFHIADNWRFFYVTQIETHRPLSAVLHEGSLSGLQAVELASNFISILAFFESLPPRMVPLFPDESLVVDEKIGLRASNFQTHFLLGLACADVESTVREFISRLSHAALQDAACEKLVQFASRLSGKVTLSQARSAIKHLQEQTAAESAAQGA